MTVINIDHINPIEACISIEHGDSDDIFEVYMTGLNPAETSNTGPASDLDDQCDVEKKDGDDFETTKEEPLVNILRLVEEEKWTSVFACVELNREVAKLSFRAESASNSDANMMLLHHMCKRSAPKEIVECVLKANNKAVSTPGKCGYLPLHFACEAGALTDVVERLLDEFPGAVKMREDRKLRLPLHLVARHQHASTAEVLALIMSYYPEATTIRDANGCHPIDYAARAKGNNHKSRYENIAVLEMGSQWIRVGQNITLRLEEDFAQRLRALEKDFGNYVDSLKAVHDEEIDRIASELLNVEFDRELMADELKKSKKDFSEMDAKFQAQLDAILDKHDRFLFLQEEVCTQRLDVQNTKGQTNDSPARPNNRETELDVTVETQAKRIMELEGSLAKAPRTTELSSNKPAANQSEEKLLSKIHGLEKTQRLNVGVIKRITAMSKDQEKKSQARILQLVNVINEQKHQIHSLKGKLDLCQEKWVSVKEELEA